MTAGSIATFVQLLVIFVLVWLVRSIRRQLIQQISLVKSLRNERDELKRTEGLLSSQIVGLEKQLGFARLPVEEQHEILAFLEAAKAEEVAARNASERAHEEEFWMYLKAKYPEWFLPKTCVCGGSMGHPAKGWGILKLNGSPPFINRRCSDCHRYEELWGDRTDLEFRQRHRLWMPI